MSTQTKEETLESVIKFKIKNFLMYNYQNQIYLLNTSSLSMFQE